MKTIDLVAMPRAKPIRLALIAHDNMKPGLVVWAREHRTTLRRYKLFATGTTGTLLEKSVGLKLHKFKSGPLGGDQQIGARIVDGEINMLIFLWDPLSPHPHDVDVKALLRIAVVYQVPIACNLATADLMIQALKQH